VPIPREIALPLGQLSELQRAGAAELERLAVAEGDEGVFRGGVVLLALGLPILAGFNALGMLVLGTSQGGNGGGGPDNGMLLGALASMFMPLAIASAIALGYVSARRRQARCLASLPFAVVHPTTLAPTCPQCTAPVRPEPDALMAKCMHCGCLALLPRMMIDERLRTRYAAVMTARLRGQAVHERIRSTSVAMNLAVSNLFIGLGVCGLIGIPIYFHLHPWPVVGGELIEDQTGKTLVITLYVGGGMTLAGVFGRFRALRRESKESEVG
jgi:hypothetical protein